MKGISINTSLPSWEHTVIEGSLLAIVGIPGVFGVVRAKTSEIKKNLYVEAAITLGGRKIHLLRRHILPHMKGNLMIVFVNEIIAVLSLIGQLGIFRIFLGGTIYKPLAMLIKYRSKTHEWAGMVGQFRDYLFNTQFVVIFPICAMIFAILSFYLLSSGLEKKQKEAYQKFPYI